MIRSTYQSIRGILPTFEEMKRVVYRILLVIVTFAVWMSLVAMALMGQTQSITYDLDNVWLDPDITRPWDPPQQMTGTFIWTYDIGDFENGSGQFIDIGIPWAHPDLSELAITTETGQIEFSLIGNFHDYSVDITLFLNEPLSPDQPSTIDLVRSKFEIQRFTIWEGHVISGSIVPRNATSNIVPDSANIILGTNTTGSLNDVEFLDDEYFCIQSGAPFSPFGPSIWLEMEGKLPSDNPTELSVLIDGHATSNDILQKIEMFNFSTNQFEEIDSRNTTWNTDSTAQIQIEGDVTKFVEVGTGAVKSRITYYQGPGAVFLSWEACIDVFMWIATD